jgi:hypothetical protein
VAGLLVETHEVTNLTLYGGHGLWSSFHLWLMEACDWCIFGKNWVNMGVFFGVIWWSMVCLSFDATCCGGCMCQEKGGKNNNFILCLAFAPPANGIYLWNIQVFTLCKLCKWWKGLWPFFLSISNPKFHHLTSINTSFITMKRFEILRRRVLF